LGIETPAWGAVELHFGVSVPYNFYWKAPLFRQARYIRSRSGGVPRAIAMEVRCQRH